MEILTNGNIIQGLPSLSSEPNQAQSEIPSNTNTEIFSTQAQPAPDSTEEVESPVIDVKINNVVCTFSVRCHLNLRTIALEGDNVEFKKAQGMVNMKLRKPSATASIWSSGKITVTGANSEENSKIAARRIARSLQKLGFEVKFSNFRIVNVLGTCSLPFGILINDFSRAHPKDVQYEPELHPGATYTIKDIKATLKVFSTGSITVTAPRVDNIQRAIEHIFPLVYQFKTVKKINPKDARYLSEFEEEEGFFIDDDDSDLMLEPGEIPTSKSTRRPTQHIRTKKTTSKRTGINDEDDDDDDEYGSLSETDDSESD